jgi:SecD/SecF fusion protein
MEHSKYRSRLTMILFVLMIGLLGIVNLGRLFNPDIPWRKKTNLKPGIDINGGISLLYEIKAAPGDLSVDLAQRVADALKKRVDPEGVRNLVWRPQGATRLEIQMPLGENSEEAKLARDEFAAMRKKLEATSIRLGDIRAAVEIENAPERAKRFDELAMGSPTRQALLEQMAATQAKFKTAEKNNDPIGKVDARDDLAKLETQLEQTNLSVARLQSTLDLYEGQIDKARKSGKQAEVDKLIKDRDAQVTAFRKQYADFLRVLESLDGFIGKYNAFTAVKGSVSDAEDLKRLLRGSGVLEFHILVTDFQSQLPDAVQARAMADRLKKEGPLPRAEDTARWYEVERPDQFKGHATFEYAGKAWALCFTTAAESMIHQESAKPWGLNRAYKDWDTQKGEAVVGFEFDAQGAALFGELTGTHINKPLAIVLDEKLISAPNINSRIEHRGQISGSYTDQELNYLIRTLNAGSLPARLADEPISERIVSPTLGADNLRDGFMACMVGLVVVAIFLLGYYYFTGAVAMVAVLMNTIIILGVLAFFGATFTLPGIAGLVLTLGSAVDANVLIFERLREEQARGLSVRMAVRNAYDRAWSAILDSNVITIITSLILYYFGSEEVKGFGLTLLIGLASSLFTSLFVTRVIFDLMLEGYHVKRFGSLPMSFPAWDRMLRPSIDWIGKAWIAVIISFLVVVIGMAAFVIEGRNMYDIEFVSGTSVQFDLKEPATRDQVMEWIGKPEFAKSLPGAQAVAVGTGNVVKTYEVVTPNEKAQEVRDALMLALQGRLNLEEPSKFDGVDAEFQQALGNGAVRLADEQAMAAWPWAKSAIQSHIGGVVIALNKLDPPLTPQQIADRVERARLQPDRASMPYRQIDVQVPGDPEKPAAMALVLVADDVFARTTEPTTQWQNDLANPMWKLVAESINKPAALQKVSNFNAQVARSTMMDAILALAFSLVLVMAYIWLRFGNAKYGGATVVAMLHDVFFVVGAIGLTHWLSNTWFGRSVLLLEPFRMNLTLVAAVLTVMGYSMMDTIVVFDRVRENRGKFGYVSRQIINDSINQTLSRTLLTAGTTIVTVLIMYIFGGPGLHGFTFALLVGILVGTYSSIAIASPILLLGGKDVKAAAAGRKAPVGQFQRTGQHPA